MDMEQIKVGTWRYLSMDNEKMFLLGVADASQNASFKGT